MNNTSLVLAFIVSIISAIQLLMGFPFFGGKVFVEPTIGTIIFQLFLSIGLGFLVYRMIKKKKS